jgi:hypothetical protein
VTPANDPAAATPRAEVDQELEAVEDALFRGPRERFVADRNAAAQRLKAQGRSEAAARLRALAKPSISAWAVNQLWWTARAQMEGLIEASRDVAAALRTGGGPAAQAAAGQARRRALEGLSGTAADVLRGAGHAAGASMLRRISTTLEALATHAAVGGAGAHMLGRLTDDLEPPGLAQVMGLGTAAATPPPAVAAVHEDEAAAAVAAAERERHAANVCVGEAARALDEAIRAADEAVLAAQRTAAAHREAQALADAARQRAEEAERVALRAGAEARREQARVEVTREAFASRTAELDRRDNALLRARLRLAGRDQGRG